MVKKVVYLYNEKNELVGILPVETIEHIETFVNLTKLAEENREKEKNEKQLAQETKEQELNKILTDLENRVRVLEIEQKYNRGELSYSEYCELLNKEAE